MDGEYVGLLDLPHPRIDTIRVFNNSDYQTFYNWPATKEQIASCGPGSREFSFGLHVCAALQQRLADPDEVAEYCLRDERAKIMNRCDMVHMPRSVLYRDIVRKSAPRLHAIEAAIAGRSPIVNVPYVDFVRLVAKLIKKHWPHLERVTGQEESWADLKEHEGLYGSQFDVAYAPSRTEDGQVVIDLLRIAQGIAEYQRVEHGYGPRRNRFFIVPVLDGEAVRITICDGKAEWITAGNISAFLDLYDILADSGLPVAIDNILSSVALGTGAECVFRNDKRLPPDSGYFLTADNVTVSEPLAADAPSSLPSLIHI